jgi:hypothetical protein
MIGRLFVPARALARFCISFPELPLGEGERERQKQSGTGKGRGTEPCGLRRVGLPRRPARLFSLPDRRGQEKEKILRASAQVRPEPAFEGGTEERRTRGGPVARTAGSRAKLARWPDGVDSGKTLPRHRLVDGKGIRAPEPAGPLNFPFGTNSSPISRRPEAFSGRSAFLRARSRMRQRRKKRTNHRVTEITEQAQREEGEKNRADNSSS